MIEKNQIKWIKDEKLLKQVLDDKNRNSILFR